MTMMEEFLIQEAWRSADAEERRNMSSNRRALDALAQEGIPMTEEQLLVAMQKTQSNHNGATPAQMNGHVDYNDATSLTMANVNAKHSSEPPHGGLRSRDPPRSPSPGRPVRPNS